MYELAVDLASTHELPRHDNPAAVVVLEKVDALQERALPGPARPNDDEDLMCGHREIDAAQDGHSSVALPQIFDRHHRLRCRGRHSVRYHAGDPGGYAHRARCSPLAIL